MKVKCSFCVRAFLFGCLLLYPPRSLEVIFVASFFRPAALESLAVAMAMPAFSALQGRKNEFVKFSPLVTEAGIVACTETPPPPATLHIPTPFYELSEAARSEIKAWQGEPPAAEPLASWQFALGEADEGLTSGLERLPQADSLVRLPHRLTVPDRAMWYTTMLQLNAPKLLRLNADDGAQVFYGGQRLRQALPNAFPLPVADSAQTLVVRVLNNALAGGLRAAALYDLEAGLSYFGRQDAGAALFKAKVPWSPEMPAERLLAQPYLQLAAGGIYQFRAVLLPGDSIQLRYAPHGQALGLPAQPTSFSKGFAVFEIPSATLSDTLYDYQLCQGQHCSPVYQFRHAPEAQASIAFTAWGDSQGGWPTFAQLSRAMAAERADFSIGLGDLVADGAQHTQWLDFLAALQPLAESRPVFPVIGNHDYDGCYDDLKPAFYHRYLRPATYFAWTYGPAAFIALDPNEQFPLQVSGAQRDWLIEQFGQPAWKQAQWRFLLVHQPPYSQGWPGYQGDTFLRELLEAYAEPARIDFVLSGHSHCYERLSLAFGDQMVHCLVLGGAGGGLEPPESSPAPKMDTLIKAHHFARFEVDSQGVEARIIGLEGQVLDVVAFGR